MTRLLINFFLSLCFFLVKGSVHLYADTDQDYLYGTVKQHSESTASVSTSVISTPLPIINNVPPTGTEKENLRATEAEDEDESTPGRKHLQLINYHLVNAESTAAYYNYLKNPLPSCTHLSYDSSDKFLVHCVIRV